MGIDLEKARTNLHELKFDKLFIEQLGWSRPASSKEESLTVDESNYRLRHISQLAGVVVIEIVSPDGSIPYARIRQAIHKKISELYHENLLIFLDANRTQSLWYWGKRDGRKVLPRDHVYVKGQPGDLFLAKLGPMFVDLYEFDKDGNIDLLKVSDKLKAALDIERVTKKFYVDYQKQHIAFTDLIEGIGDERDRRWYASVLMNRLMFIYFLQLKYFLDGGDRQYLENKLAISQKTGKDKYYKVFLHDLFFQGFAMPEEDRQPDVNQRLGKIRYLNGGLFLKHSLEQKYSKIQVPDKAFENLFGLFKAYSWSLDDTPGGKDDEINPAVLGYIFEKYINQKASNNQKAFGAYYTRTEITEYLCERTIHRLILDKVREPDIPGFHKGRKYESIAELLLNLDTHLCKLLLDELLPNLRILDPACGSGAFLVAAMKTLIDIYAAIFGKITFLHDSYLSRKLEDIALNHKNVGYYIKKRIITDNLFGVDLMEEATEIAKLRLFLALVSSAENESQLEPLPNIDFNILCGNSLIGLIHVDYDQLDERRKQGNLFFRGFRELLAEKNRTIEIYRQWAGKFDDLTSMRDKINQLKSDAQPSLNEVLVDEFKHLGIKYEQATWDTKNNKEGKRKKRDVTLKDIMEQRPFHWGYEFDEIVNKNGGFDVIITNPPWEAFKPQTKEFFEQYSNLITKKKMTIQAFEREQVKLLKDPDVKSAWEKFLSSHPHISAYFHSASQYSHQIAFSNGKKVGSDVNLYKLFTEQCYNLLGKNGQCGLVIPAGICTDLGAKGLRELLFSKTRIDGVFCLDNQKLAFDGVHRSIKFAVLTFEKNGSTDKFPAAFMRQDLRELTRFPQHGAFNLNVSDIRSLSPDSLSIIEVKSKYDQPIALKMLKCPLLGQDIPGLWNIALTSEFHMTNARTLFRNKATKGCLPLFEGKMIWQFDHKYAAPRIWIDEAEGRARLLGREPDHGQTLDYQDYRLAFRSTGENTNERNFIATVIPPRVFCGNSLTVSSGQSLDHQTLVFVCALFNSFILDYAIRLKIARNLNIFYVYQLPLPRLLPNNHIFQEIVKRSGRLICTSSEYESLSTTVGLTNQERNPIDSAERAKLRAELDGIVAHLYGLTEEEFTYILTTFPLVHQSVKDAALQAYRDLVPKPAVEQVRAILKAGESAIIEFKSSARWDLKLGQKSKEIEQIIIKTVAAFLNTQGGDLFIGIDDNGGILGLEHDYKLVKGGNRDGYGLFLGDLIFNSLGKDLVAELQFIPHSIDGNEVWQVICKSANRAVFVKDDKGQEQLYVRRGNATVALSAKEAIEYSKTRWRSID